MTAKRQILELLRRDELVEIAGHHEAQVAQSGEPIATRDSMLCGSSIHGPESSYKAWRLAVRRSGECSLATIHEALA